MNRGQRRDMPVHVALEVGPVVGGVALELLAVGVQVMAAHHRKDDSAKNNAREHKPRHRQKLHCPVAIAAGAFRHDVKPVVSVSQAVPCMRLKPQLNAFCAKSGLRRRVYRVLGAKPDRMGRADGAVYLGFD